MTSQLQACAQLERRIRAATQEGKSLFHPELRQLRSELRAACEAALFEDYARAQRHDLEQLLWKSAFYRPIEEFRRRIREHTAAGNEDLLGKTKTAFHLYLEDGKQFYIRLAVRLQETFGHVGLELELPAEQAQKAQQQQQQQPLQQQQQPLQQQQGNPVDCQASVYRCLICLGDLARYQAGNVERHQRDWAECRRWYQQAARVYPQGGNSYNQLAVLATHVQDELGAAFYYLRALNVPSPFAVARENLVTMLDANRTSYTKLTASAAAGGRSGGSSGGAAGPVPQRGVRAASALERELRIRWVRVLGILHLKLDLDAFPDFLAAALNDLDDYLYRLRTSRPPPSTAAAASGSGDGSTPPLLLAAALCTLCTAHAAVEDHAAHAGAGASYADSLQRSVVRGYALTAVAELAARLAVACASSSSSSSSKGDGNSIDPASTHTNGAAGAELLPALWALLRWMGTPLAAAALVPPLRDSGAGSAVVAGGAPEQAAALQSALRRLWGALAQLVAALHPAVALAAAKDPLQGPAAGAAASLPAGGNRSSGSAGSAHASGVQLPEDWHLQCFAPLPEAPNGAGDGDAAADAAQAAAPASEPARWLLRARRVLGATRALAAALQPADGSREAPPKGDPLALFLTAVRISMGGAARERPQQAQQGAAQQAPAVPAAQQPPAAPAEQQQQQQQHQQAPRGGLPGLLPAAGAVGGAVVAGDGVAGMEVDTIEEEEVIVYKPTPPRPSPAPSPPAAGTSPKPLAGSAAAAVAPLAPAAASGAALTAQAGPAASHPAPSGAPAAAAAAPSAGTDLLGGRPPPATTPPQQAAQQEEAARPLAPLPLPLSLGAGAGPEQQQRQEAPGAEAAVMPPAAKVAQAGAAAQRALATGAAGWEIDSTYQPTVAGSAGAGGEAGPQPALQQPSGVWGAGLVSSPPPTQQQQQQPPPGQQNSPPLGHPAAHAASAAQPLGQQPQQQAQQVQQPAPGLRAFLGVSAPSAPALRQAGRYHPPMGQQPGAPQLATGLHSGLPGGYPAAVSAQTGQAASLAGLQPPGQHPALGSYQQPQQAQQAGLQPDQLSLLRGLALGQGAGGSAAAAGVLQPPGAAATGNTWLPSLLAISSSSTGGAVGGGAAAAGEAGGGGGLYSAFSGSAFGGSPLLASAATGLGGGSAYPSGATGIGGGASGAPDPYNSIVGAGLPSAPGLPAPSSGLLSGLGVSAGLSAGFPAGLPLTNDSLGLTGWGGTGTAGGLGVAPPLLQLGAGQPSGFFGGDLAAAAAAAQQPTLASLGLVSGGPSLGGGGGAPSTGVPGVPGAGGGGALGQLGAQQPWA